VSVLSGLLRVAYGRYVPEPVRNALRLNLLLVQRDREPVRTTAPAGRIVVLAPHMDDEVFGCGGTLAKVADGGGDVTVLFMTNGRKGYAAHTVAGRSAAEIAGWEARLSATRKEESRRAAKILGYGDAVYFDLPDGALACTTDAVRRLASALRSLQPDAIFLPFLTDVHHDHWVTNVVFAEAAPAAALRPDVTCWGYEVWTPVPANAVVDVTDVFERKARAMAEFTSQTEYEYQRAMAALNTYRSLFTACGAGFAEGFYTAALPIYLGLYRAVAVGHRRPRAAAR
jgi:LmbE family N-acetylglucosaminyl deacetylase